MYKDKSKLKKQKGITLIALVITIVVLIILAGVAINLTLSQNGIFNKATKARNDYQQAATNEQVALNEITDYITNIEFESNTTNPTEKAKDIATVIGKDYFTEPTTIKDNNGNLIRVPEGFKIAEDSGLNVTEGIIIEDNDIIEGIGNNRGNQYVWIPVGNEIKKSDGTTVNIVLGRYIFADGTNDKSSDGKTILSKGTPILKQSSENYTQEILINSAYKELTISREGVSSSGNDGINTTALNLKGFINSVNTNGGYYIARYEASYGVDEKPNSKVSNNYSVTKEPTTEGTLWNFITQINAAKSSKNLYETVETDLMNSYAWDTAIIYIQDFSDDIDYSWQDGKSIKSSLTNTGVNKDEKCKINDMASNTFEWITEYSTNSSTTSSGPCAYRGGDYNYNNIYTSSRYSNDAAGNYNSVTFRTILYM